MERGKMEHGTWEHNGEGFAKGPSQTITTEVDGREISVTVSAVWTDEDGVCVSIDAGDEPIPAALAGQAAAAMLEFSLLQAPKVAA